MWKIGVRSRMGDVFGKVHGPKRCKKSLWGGSRDDHSGRRGRIGGVQQSDTERPTRGPSTVARVEFGEDVFGIMAAALRNGQHASDNGNDTTKSPENSKSLGG